MNASSEVVGVWGQFASILIHATRSVLGPAVASATIALIFDKQSAGEVKSPGGYLRAMVERAQKGELYLDRSFYGRMNEVRLM